MPKHDYEFDLVTLGAGSGGTRASRVSSQKYGAKVACIELPFGFISSDEIGGAGGTCVIRGCVPKKLLVYGSAFSEEFSDAGGFGWKASKPDFDWTHLMSKKTKEIERLNGVYNKLLSNAGVELIEGRGSLKDAHTVEVALSGGGTRTLTANKILLAVGGKPVKAPIEGSVDGGMSPSLYGGVLIGEVCATALNFAKDMSFLQFRGVGQDSATAFVRQEHAITSDEVLALPDLPTPRRIVAVGAGYIAIEFASMFNGFGVDMHLMYRKDLPLAGFDGECRQRVAENLQQRGLHLYPKSTPTKIVKQSNGSFCVTYKGEAGETTLDDVGLVVFGTGRSPNTRNIGLEAAGVKTEKDGTIIVDEYSKTSAENIYALGDVTNRLNLTPVAIMEGMAFAATAFGGTPTKPIHERVASAVFTQPPMATVGLSEEAAVDTLSGNLDIYTSSFRPMKNTVSGREEKTFMKIIVQAETDEVVGVHMVGPDTPEIMQGVGIAVKCRATKAQFDSTVGIHPTAAEEIVTMRTKTRRVQGRAKKEPDTNESRSYQQ